MGLYGNVANLWFLSRNGAALVALFSLVLVFGFVAWNFLIFEPNKDLKLLVYIKVIFINIVPKFLTTSRFFLTKKLNWLVFMLLIINIIKIISLVNKHKVRNQKKIKKLDFFLNIFDIKIITACACRQ